MGKRGVSITNEQIEEMRFMEDELHMTRREIAKETGVCVDTLTNLLGVKNKAAGKRLSFNTVKIMEELRSKGLSNKQIALELGVSYKTVHCKLGNQPNGSRSEYGSIIAHVTGDSFVKQKEVYKLQRISTCVTFAGKDWTYEATDKGFVKISAFAGVCTDMDIRQLENLIGELQEVYDWMKQNNTTPVILLDGKPKSQEKQLPL